jgi:hypothetical protein
MAEKDGKVRFSDNVVSEFKTIAIEEFVDKRRLADLFLMRCDGIFPRV